MCTCATFSPVFEVLGSPQKGAGGVEGPDPQDPHPTAYAPEHAGKPVCELYTSHKSQKRPFVSD